MKMYYSNLGSVNFKDNRLDKIGVLFSYYGLKKIVKPEYCDLYFLDSGAFSAWNQNKEIDLDKYIEFIQDNKSLVDVYASLDVIGDEKKSWGNYIEMKKQGLDPLPAFHIGEDVSYLKKYADQTNYIALGGIAKTSSKDRLVFLNNVFSIFPDSEKIGFHGFGVAQESLLLQFPWKTCDASTTHVRARTGCIVCPYNACLTINPKGSQKLIAWQTDNKLKKVKKWVEESGFNWEIATSQTSEGIEERCKINIFYYEQLSEKVPVKYNPKISYLF